MPENQTEPNEKSRASQARKEYLFSAIGFTFAVPCYVWFSLSDLVARDGWRWVIGPIGAFFFGVMAILSWVSYFRRLPAEKSDQLILRTLWRIVLAPIVLIILAAILAGIFFGFSWLFTIPSWAAVIIVLLLVLIARR